MTNAPWRRLADWGDARISGALPSTEDIFQNGPLNADLLLISQTQSDRCSNVPFIIEGTQ